MSGLGRLAPLLLTRRWPLVIACLLAIAVSGLWAAALMVSYPIVKVLLQGQNLHEYAASEMAAAERTLSEQTERLSWVDGLLSARRRFDPSDQSADSRKLLRDRTRCQELLNNATQQFARFQMLRQKVLPWFPKDAFHSLAAMLLVLGGILAVKGICTYWQECLLGQIVERTLQALRSKLFRHVTQLDAQTIGREGTASLMARFGYDLGLISQGLNLLGGRVMVEPLKAAACIGSAFLVNWRLTLLSLIVAPPAALVFGRIGKQLKRAARKQMESMSRVYAVLEQTFNGLRVVQTYGGQRMMRQAFHRENKQYYREAMQIQKFDALTNPTTEAVATVAVMLALLPGAYLVLRGETTLFGVQLSATPMDVAELALMYTLLGGVLDPARRLASVYSKLRKSSAACERVYALLDRAPEIQEVSHALPFPSEFQTLEFRNVSFSYGTADASQTNRGPALDDVSFDVQAGETVALVGGNGSGKSTLASLLNRLLDPTSGSILVDGCDLRLFSLTDLRTAVRVVPQQAMLFDRSLEENVRCGKSDATPEELRASLAAAAVDTFVDQLPDGLQTQVGERGQRLSGGQRQRVAFARALVGDPSILILDEATSAVDLQTERQIYAQLVNLTRGRTTFIVTHALTPELLNVVTKVVFLERGKVLGAGTHEALLSHLPAYQGLFDSHVQKRAA